jgi:hypothetical protein
MSTETTSPVTETAAPAAVAPKYVTADDLAKRDKALHTRLEKLVQDFEAKITATPQRADVEPQPQGGGVQESPEYKGLVKRLGEMEQRVKTAEECADAERRATADAKMRQSLSDSLTGAGVDPKHLKHAVGYLVDAEKRVRLTDDGTIVYQDGADAFDLATGLKGWLASDDAKLYLAPRGVVGSGSTPSAQQTRTGKPNAAPTREQLAMSLQQALTGNQVYIG